MDLTTYLASVKPEPDDPTYLLLKSHLKFEELLWMYLHRELRNATALQGERLTFRQILAVARAISTRQYMQPGEDEYWIWEALTKLHKLRNMLAHEATPPDLDGRISEYVRFLKDRIAPNAVRSIYITPGLTDRQVLSTLMMVLYYIACHALGFEISDGHTASATS